MSDLNDPRFATTLARGLSVLRAFRVTDDGLGQSLPHRRGQGVDWRVVNLD